ncbi:neural Wiskott-Aldrich syndrome protein [Archocentrus centrarchus]|uniref:neural Wiskott-Aldrich syndrome protein n=1 Tax=Archocentrus centrarchus TaxID=63155 RepID=UPI0011EA3923|nr:neural Wiskott-Aldrich syndrome protein-like [Archocentrus centrarchus]
MSDLLTIREKGILISLLEPQYKLIISTVAQILQAKSTPGESPSWSRLDCGVVCLIEDLSMHSYFLHLYCVKRAKLLWEQEVYIPFKYTVARTFFHTFPADDYQVGINFANEAEAEEFHQAVEAACGKMTSMVEKTTAGSSTHELAADDLGLESLDNLNVEKDLSMDTSSTGSPPASSCFKDLDPAMRRLLMQAKLTEEDLKGKDIAEAVDCIINKFGGLKAVQRELRNRGSISQTLPRSAGASISLALKKGPLPPVPSIKENNTFQQTPKCTNSLDESQTDPLIPSPPPPPAPVSTERIRKSASFKDVGSRKATERGDLFLAALREAFKEKRIHQQSTSEDGSPTTASPNTN